MNCSVSPKRTPGLWDMAIPPPGVKEFEASWLRTRLRRWGGSKWSPDREGRSDREARGSFGGRNAFAEDGKCHLFERKVTPCQAWPCLGAGVISLALQPALCCHARGGGQLGSPRHRVIQIVAMQLQLPSKTGNKFQLFLWVCGTNVPRCTRSCLVPFVESALESVHWLCFFLLFCNTGPMYGMAVVGMQVREVNLTWREGFKKDLGIARSSLYRIHLHVIVL